MEIDPRRSWAKTCDCARGAHVRALLIEALFQAEHHVDGIPSHD